MNISELKQLQVECHGKTDCPEQLKDLVDTVCNVAENLALDPNDSINVIDDKVCDLLDLQDSVRAQQDEASGD